LDEVTHLVDQLHNKRSGVGADRLPAQSLRSTGSVPYSLLSGVCDLDRGDQAGRKQDDESVEGEHRGGIGELWLFLGDQRGMPWAIWAYLQRFQMNVSVSESDASIKRDGRRRKRMGTASGSVEK
jgi:hypothetical protein